MKEHSFVVAELQQTPLEVAPRRGYSQFKPAVDADCAGYFVIIRRGGAVGVGAGGEIVNVTQVFQPWGRFSAANSL
jgi:hypothetical protein